MAEDRRKYPTCQVPCKPIADKLDKTISKTLFMWLIGGLSFFVLIVQGGFLWNINSGISDIKVEQATVKAELKALKYRFEDHIRISEKKFDELDILNKRLHFNLGGE